MFFSEREVNSCFSFIEINISKWGLSCDCWIKSESEFPHHHFTLKFHDPVIKFLEGRREVVV
jgi:hypothetical protein